MAQLDTLGLSESTMKGKEDNQMKLDSSNAIRGQTEKDH